MSSHPLAALTLARTMLRSGRHEAAAGRSQRAPAASGAAANPVYLTEHFLPGLDAQHVERITARLEAAAERLRRAGADVRCLACAGLPGDESLFSVIAATRVEDVQRALERAGLSVDRIVPAVWHSDPTA